MLITLLEEVGMSSENTRESIRQGQRERLRRALVRIRRGAPASWAEFLAGLEADVLATLDAWDRAADRSQASCGMQKQFDRIPPLLRRAKCVENLILGLDHYVAEVVVGRPPEGGTARPVADDELDSSRRRMPRGRPKSATIARPPRRTGRDVVGVARVQTTHVQSG
jgi:hypothetical protein